MGGKARTAAAVRARCARAAGVGGGEGEAEVWRANQNRALGLEALHGLCFFRQLSIASSELRPAFRFECTAGLAETCQDPRAKSPKWDKPEGHL